MKKKNIKINYSGLQNIIKEVVDTRDYRFNYVQIVSKLSPVERYFMNDIVLKLTKIMEKQSFNEYQYNKLVKFIDKAYGNKEQQLGKETEEE